MRSGDRDVEGTVERVEGELRDGSAAGSGLERRPSRGGIIGGPGMFLAYLLVGIYFGVVLTKSEVVSWFRIQEMFRFQSFHMYGIIGSAILVAALSVRLIKRLEARSATGERIELPPKRMGRGVRYGLGGTIFGAGWALTGACPGPLFALLGSGVTVIAVAIVSALVGTWTYGVLRPRLPHY